MIRLLSLWLNVMLISYIYYLSEPNKLCRVLVHTVRTILIDNGIMEAPPQSKTPAKQPRGQTADNKGQKLGEAAQLNASTQTLIKLLEDLQHDENRNAPM